MITGTSTMQMSFAKCLIIPEHYELHDKHSSAEGMAKSGLVTSIVAVMKTLFCSVDSRVGILTIVTIMKMLLLSVKGKQHI